MNKRKKIFKILSVIGTRPVQISAQSRYFKSEIRNNILLGNYSNMCLINSPVKCYRDVTSVEELFPLAASMPGVTRSWHGARSWRTWRARERTPSKTRRHSRSSSAMLLRSGSTFISLQEHTASAPSFNKNDSFCTIQPIILEDARRFLFL